MRSRRPKLSLTSWLMLVGLMLGLILQPVLASIGELHQLTHEPASAHHALSSDVAEGDAGNAETLHQVHQFAHCCGHVVMAPSAPMAVALIGRDEPRALADPPQVPSRQSLAPFRPPNTA